MYNPLRTYSVVPGYCRQITDEWVEYMYGKKIQRDNFKS